MPLPQALAARLAKRGIIKLPSQSKEPEQLVTNTLQEEIIAEDYDDAPQPGETPIPPPPEKFDKYAGWFSCPNKWNVYHECTPACQEHWNEVKEIDKDYNRRRVKMLLKYPLPAHWQEVLDIGLRRYYYWNTEKELVSWLPPGHPRCRVSLSAAHLRRQMMEEREQRLREEGKDPDASPDRQRPSGGETSDEEDMTAHPKQGPEEAPLRRRKRKAPLPLTVSAPTKEDHSSDKDSGSESMEEGNPPKEKRLKEGRERSDPAPPDKERDRDRGRDKDRGGRGRDRKGPKKRQEESDALDPMDPAAYSECPRGTWSSGLPEKNEARTGVDPTASGPLFQMRPYPNPGAVLRANSAVSAVGPKKPT